MVTNLPGKIDLMKPYIHPTKNFTQFKKPIVLGVLIFPCIALVIFSGFLQAGEKNLTVLAKEDFTKGSDNWEPKDPSAWKVVKQDSESFFSMFKDSNYKPEVRSPVNFALLKDISVTDFILDVDMRSTQKVYGHQDLCLFFGYQDASHFYYVHLGRKADAHANSIFLVHGEPRVSIAEKRTDGTNWSKDWHHVRVKRDTVKGTIEVFFDNMKKPVMTTTDKHFLHGRVGIGSFDDTGDFDNFQLRGVLNKSK